MKNLSEIFSKKKEEPVKSTPKSDVSDSLPKDLKFIVVSEFGELLDIAMQLALVEKYETVFCVTDSNYEKIGRGILKTDQNWHEYIGKNYIWVIDGCGMAHLQDWLRDQGENVVGTNQEMADMENDRQKGQEWFEDAGFNQPFSKNFTDIDECLEFVTENRDTQYILKQNGDLPKSINHKAKFEDNSDMIFHVNEMKKSWSESALGKFDVDLMEIVKGMEVAVSGFFNGHDYLRDEYGKVVAFINHEQKKQSDGDLGSTTGEMGTLFYGTDEDHDLVLDVLLNGVIMDKLVESDYRGVFDINCIITEDGIVGLEPTSRFGIPASSYEFIEGMETKTGEVLAAMALGIDLTIEIVKGWGIVQVIVAPPFPTEADLEESATSLGEKLWIIGGEGIPIKEFTKDQRKHIHLENFEKTGNGEYKVATKNGYMLTVTGTGKSIKDAREKMLEYVKDNVYISDMFYRQDLGKNVEEHEESIENNTI